MLALIPKCAPTNIRPNAATASVPPRHSGLLPPFPPPGAIRPMTVTTLLLVDVQKDFHPGGSLAIPAAGGDAERIAALLREHPEKITRVVATLDSHQRLHIAHPGFWRSGASGDPPAPFTVITSQDVAAAEGHPGPAGDARSRRLLRPRVRAGGGRGGARPPQVRPRVHEEAGGGGAVPAVHLARALPDRLPRARRGRRRLRGAGGVVPRHGRERGVGPQGREPADGVVLGPGGGGPRGRDDRLPVRRPGLARALRSARHLRPSPEPLRQLHGPARRRALAEGPGRERRAADGLRLVRAGIRSGGGGLPEGNGRRRGAARDFREPVLLDGASAVRSAPQGAAMLALGE